MRLREFRSEIWLPLKPEALFPFFADASNLNLITPEWLDFQILTPEPIAMGQGTLIDYRLRVRRIPLRWRTRINTWDPPHGFVDEQIHGPYRRWVHEHRFESWQGGTIARDFVRYAVPFDFAVHRWLVQPDIRRIFQFRADALRRRFGNGNGGAP